MSWCRRLCDYLMKNTVELSAEFIRRAALRTTHYALRTTHYALLKDECGVEYQEPPQVQYYALFKDHEALKHVAEALKHVAEALGCMTHIEYQESSSGLMVVGEETAVGTVRQVWRTALKTKQNKTKQNKTYTTTLNERHLKGLNTI